MTARLPRPRYNAAQAIDIARRCVDRGVYQLGTGDHDTPDDAPSDCAGFASNKCYGIPRHRKGFNHGPWSSVSDDLNSNSAIEDAEHEQDLYEIVKTPRAGDILAYPTIRIKGRAQPFIGHEAIIETVPAEWDEDAPDYVALGIIQCCGPNGRRPGIIRSTGVAFAHHDDDWSKPQHRTRILRVRG